MATRVFPSALRCRSRAVAAVGYFYLQKVGSSTFAPVGGVGGGFVPTSSALVPGVSGSFPGIPDDFYYDITWTPTEANLNYQQYYERYLRQILFMECYPQMSSVYSWVKTHYFVGVNDIVSAAIRYPKCFWPEFINEIIAKRVVVEDPKIVYPDFISGSPSIYRNPIQIITPTWPPLGFYKIYTDGSPSFNDGEPGGGGVGFVSDGSSIPSDGTGSYRPRNLSIFKVRVAHGTALETELRVMIAAAKHAWVVGLRRIIFVSDCLDIIEGLQGGRYVQEDDTRELFRELRLLLDSFEEVVFEFTPREGLAVIDAIAVDMRKTLRNQARYGWFLFNEGELYEVNYETQIEYVQALWRRLDIRVPVLRFELVKNVSENMTHEDIVLKQRFCPWKK